MGISRLSNARVPSFAEYEGPKCIVCHFGRYMKIWNVILNTCDPCTWLRKYDTYKYCIMPARVEGGLCFIDATEPLKLSFSNKSLWHYFNFANLHYEAPAFIILIIFEFFSLWGTSLYWSVKLQLVLLKWWAIVA